MILVQEVLSAIESSGHVSVERMLSVILAKCRRYTSAEAGSIFVVRSVEGIKELQACSLQNDRVRVHSDMFTLPLDLKSIAGYVAETGEVVEIDDLYNLEPSAPYSFNRSFDERDGYRSQSMLAFPLKNLAGEVIGVVQLLNRIDSIKVDGTPLYSTFTLSVVDDMSSVTTMLGVIVERMALLIEIDSLKAELESLRMR